MNNLKNIIVFLLAITTLVSCKKDLLETLPNDRISTVIFWKTDQDATLAANAIYTYMAEGANHFMSWDGMTDIGYTHSPQSSESFILQGQFDAQNERVSSDWNNAYAGIRAANTFLKHVSDIQADDTALIRRLTGEVKTMRAYFYIRLVSLFGDVPLITSEITLEESKKLTRTPSSQIWDFISQELTSASNELPLTQKETGRITKGAALALLARAMLFAGRYQDAVNAAQAVMDLHKYSLYPSYENLFTYSAEGNQEVILDIQFIKDTYSNNIFATLAPKSQNGNSIYVPTKNLVDSYQMNNGSDIDSSDSGFDPANPYKNRDPRLGYSIYVIGDTLPNNKVFNPKPDSKTGDAVGSTFTVSPTGFNVKKYVNKEDLTTPSNSGINFIVIRYAEVLLTYAEAKIELNQIDASVYDAINQVRQRPDVNMPPITPDKTQEELRSIVRHERLVELSFEGLRFFDIRRWKIAESVMPGKVYGMTYKDKDGNSQTVEVLGWTQFWDNRDYLWPIPQKEIDLDPELTQNPGW